MNIQILNVFDSNARVQRRHTRELERLSPDANLTLDGSEWARLANLRLHRERHPHDTHQDLLTSAQVAKSYLSHNHLTAQTAKNHWFYPDSTTYDAINTASARATELLQSKRLNEVLETVDQSWTSSADKKTEDIDPDEFWVAPVDHK